MTMIGATLDALLAKQHEELLELRRRIEGLERQALARSPGAEWVTKKAFLERNAGIFTEGGLDWLLFNRQTNGLGRFVRQPGRQLVIQESAFLAAALELGEGRRVQGRAAPRPQVGKRRTVPAGPRDARPRVRIK